MNNFYRVIGGALVGLVGLVGLNPMSARGGEAPLPQSVVLAKITDGSPGAAPQSAFNRDHPGVRAALAVKERHAPQLMAQPEVVGIAVGLTEDDRPGLLVLVKRPPEAGALPESLEGVPLIVHVSGELRAMAPGRTKIDPTARFPRPVPIGVSTGNVGECSAGTIGARLRNELGNVFALSNNHVYALENSAQTGSKILQPGRFDTNCAVDEENVIGTLADFEPIDFSDAPCLDPDACNTLDAAIASTSTTQLGNATPANGYGVPKKETVPEEVNQLVQKYGRTSALTKGVITGIEGEVRVGYDSGTARFDKQIFVQARKPFIKPGDSGSLLVTDPGRNPVGLLFAGSADGKFAIANPIVPVLLRFGVSVDGE